MSKQHKTMAGMQSAHKTLCQINDMLDDLDAAIGILVGDRCGKQERKDAVDSLDLVRQALVTMYNNTKTTN